MNTGSRLEQVVKDSQIYFQGKERLHRFDVTLEILEELQILIKISYCKNYQPKHLTKSAQEIEHFIVAYQFCDCSKQCLQSHSNVY